MKFSYQNLGNSGRDKNRRRYFGHKHVETGLNWSHELSIFLKYHKPLTILHFFHVIIFCK